MIDFVISGTRGFIGGCLLTGLKSAGFSAVSDRQFRERPEPARYFIHCANIPGNPLANARLLRDRIALAESENVQVFFQIQSFVTLQGAGRIDPDRFNCGKRPWMIDAYALGKLLLECIILGRARRGGKMCYCFFYIPAVLGEGGAWDRILEQGRRYGIMLPPRLPRDARANVLDVVSLVRKFEELAQGNWCLENADAPHRVILTEPRSSDLTWERFLAGDAPRSAIRSDDGWRSRLRYAICCVILLGMGVVWRLRVVTALERSQRGLVTSGALTSEKPADARRAEPVRFRCLTRYIMYHQGYILGRE